MNSWRQTGIPLAVVFGIATGAALVGCSDSTGTRSPDPLVQRIIDMGFRPDMIRDRGDYFVVEGDIVIWKRDLQPSVGSVPNNNPFRPQFQWSTYQLVQFEQAQNIVVAISPSVSSGWAEAVRAAMAEWDSVPGIALHFVEGSPANITIQQTLIDQGLTCARATFPTSNGPGNLNHGQLMVRDQPSRARKALSDDA